MKNFFSITVILLLVAILVVTNFTDWTEDDQEPNLIDVTGDTSQEGVAITSPSDSVLKEGDKAPAFALEDLEGNQIKGLNADQEYVLMNFWATWCPPCVEEMPALQAFEDKHSEKIKVVAVNVTNTESSVSKVKNFVDEGSFDYTILLDKEDAVYEAYSIINMPTSFFIRTSDQTIVKRVNGSMDENQMEDYLREIEET